MMQPFPSDYNLYRLHTTGDKLTAAEIAALMGLNEDSVRGRIWRVHRALSDAKDERIETLRAENTALKRRIIELETPTYSLGEPLRLSGDFVIAGDIHCSTVNGAFMRRPLDIAERYLSKPRRFIIAGDFLNGNAFSDYAPVYPEPSFADELSSARRFLDMYLKVFDEVYIIVGNHDLRVTRHTNGAISPENLMRMVSQDKRVTVSHWGHLIIDTPKGEWRCTHGSEFSVNQLTVADALAAKYRQHILSWHEHHTAFGLDRFKHNMIVNGGGLFDPSVMAYTQIEDNKKPNMANGFVLLMRGYPYLFTAEFTDWNWWLGEAAEMRKTA